MTPNKNTDARARARTHTRTHAHTRTHTHTHTHTHTVGRGTGQPQKPLHAQHTTLTRNGWYTRRFSSPQTKPASKRAAADTGLKPRGHWDRLSMIHFVLKLSN